MVQSFSAHGAICPETNSGEEQLSVFMLVCEQKDEQLVKKRSNIENSPLLLKKKEPRRWEPFAVIESLLIKLSS